MPTIQLLSDHLISQIAAGEVVERPASVVKELVENSLDAGATELEIDLEAGGKRRIRVVDDGSGMDRDDALLAFDRHATSKIASFEELERVATLGFRGEALASIAAVARVELISAVEPGDGHRVRIEGGRVKVAEPAARPRGTTIEVASLFFNVPARRKFLKTTQTELRHCLQVVQGYALARPDVRFTVRHNGRVALEALATGEGDEGGRRRIGQLFGDSLAENLAAIPDRSGDDGGPRPGDDGGPRPDEPAGERISGFVGNRETTRGRRYYIFVNRRLLRDRQILATFYRAVREEWRSEDFPALFLFLDLPPEEVDVNVHPQKAEVRFRDPKLLHRVAMALRGGLAAALGEEAAPLRQPSGRPTQPFAWQGAGGRGKSYTGGGFAAGGFGSGRSGGGRSPADEWEVREPEGGPEGATGTSAVYDPGGAIAGGAQRFATPSFAPADRPAVPLSGRSGEPRPFRLIGQYKGTLIMLEGPDGLYLIDQHVAHERLLYERLRRTMQREKTVSQRLLSPQLLEVGPAEAARLRELGDQLEECGFAIAELSGDTLGVTAVPAVLSPAQGEKLLLALAEEGIEGDGNDPQSVRLGLLEALAASLSCKGAVKMHHPLKAQEMEALVAELFAAEQPYACPHGRPIVLKMTDADLERRFGRR